MADDRIKLTASVRTEFGKGAARRSRRAGLIPAVLYGHGEAPQHLALPSHDTFLIVKDHANALVTLDIEGKEQMALVKDVQRDPVKRDIEHLDLLIVRRGEKVTVDVPVHVEGESAPGTIHQVELQTITLTVPATDIPESITVSVEGLEEGSIIRVGDIAAPQGAVIDTDPEWGVVVISVPRVAAEDLETPSDEDEEAAEAEETEGEESAEDGEGGESSESDES
ncbi:50S ribosomal protein L25/general stress protein Ctc [Georgenia alba]|uniref:Large ribosomal subunit protein bL25 n=1 Tax=Georgenia alba TaxID=2233858 RepID=A0ABW2QAB6_9MICO